MNVGIDESFLKLVKMRVAKTNAGAADENMIPTNGGLTLHYIT